MYRHALVQGLRSKTKTLRGVLEGGGEGGGGLSAETRIEPEP